MSEFPRFLVFIYTDHYPQGGFNDLAWYGNDLVKFLDSEPFRQLKEFLYEKNIQIVDTRKNWQSGLIGIDKQIIFSLKYSENDTIPNWVNGPVMFDFFISRIENFIADFIKFSEPIEEPLTEIP